MSDALKQDRRSHASTTVNLAYFGKVPSRADFVKSGNSLSLLTSLDNWVARAMDKMTEDMHWKKIFDESKPFHFAFLGSQHNLVIAGHFAPSRDSAQRRFPFVITATMEVGDANAFIMRSPLALTKLWNRMSQFCTAIMGAPDASADLNTLSGASVDVDLGSSAYKANLGDFLELQTMGGLAAQFRDCGFEGNCRHLILALGLLLQPVMASGSNRLDKSLCLPLPKDPLYQCLTAAFWMSLINPFLQRADFELTLYIAELHQRPTLVVGFNGASSTTLEAVLNPASAQEHLIGFEQAAWVEDSVASDYGVAKLSSYLEQPRLSLASVQKTFAEVFLGA
jgi:type VI secretion system protein ImpM